MTSAGSGIGSRTRALLPWLGVVRPRPLPAHRTISLSAVLILVGAVLSPYALDPGSASSSGLALTWWQLAVVSGLAGVFVFHVEINSEAHTFSLSEVPLVLGLFFCQPRDVVLARLLGEALVLVVIERQTSAKLLFNLAVFFAETAGALAVFRLLGGRHDALAAEAGLVALGAAATAALLGALSVWTVIRVHGGRVDARQLVVASAVTATGNTSLALVAAVLLRADPPALAPLAVIAAVVVAGYRGYTQMAKRYAGLEMLYQFVQITSGPQRPDETLQRVQDEARRLLRAERAVIALYHPGEDTPWLFQTTTGQDAETAVGTSRDGRLVLPDQVCQEVLGAGLTLLIPRTAEDAGHRAVLTQLGARDCIAAPLVSGGRASGVIVICDRLGGVSTFDAEDARLFATLASQAAIALENGRLIDRLQEQVQAREHEAKHDALTGLPNRSLFADRLASALPPSELCFVGVLLMDLDGFKEVNDTLGHHVGDDLLCQVAQRVSACVASRGTVARLGGDEFAILLPNLDDEDAAVRIAHEINDAVRAPVTLATLTMEIGASVGVAVSPEHGDDPSTLLQRADVAMYTAKRGQLGVSVYDPTADQNSQLQLQLAGELRTAIASRQIEVWYQPIARCSDGQVVAAEALVRWDHPDLGRIGPDQFVPIAERSGLIHELTVYVTDHALAQARVWRDLGMDLTVNVNLPPQVLRDLDWPAKVTALLRKHSAAPSWLTFEVTESGIMSDPENMIRMLDDMAAAGIRFAIDDFGTGYSSLAYLQQLPVSKVKIDRSFVMAMVGDPANASIVRSVVDLARSLGLDVVAEGVEDQRTLDLLTSIDCGFVQGYYLSRPIPAIELTEWMTLRTSRQAAARHAVAV